MVESTQQRRRVVMLTHGAVLLWLVSLLLPGIIVNDAHEHWMGAAVLAFGLLMGWMVHGWAAYANLFFAWAVLRLYSKGQPNASLVIMWFLVATLPLFAGAAVGGNVPKLESWGWGVVVWIGSFAVASVAAMVAAGHLATRGLRIAGVFGIAAIAAVVGFRGYQWSEANEQERRAYLPIGAAFAARELCGIPLTWPDRPVVAPGIVVQLDVDPALRSLAEGRYLHLPELPDYQEEGYRWISYRTSTNDVFRIRAEQVTPSAVLEARPAEDEGAVMRLKDATGKVLYEQRLRRIPRKAYQATWCPEAQLGHVDSSVSTDAALRRALGLPDYPVEPAPPATLEPDATTQRCDLGEDIDRTRNLRAWDGRAVALSPGTDVKRMAGYCSGKYAALVTVSASWDKGQGHAAVRLFDRATLRPVALLSGNLPCGDDCMSLNGGQSRGLRVVEDAAIIDMPGGEVRTVIFRPQKANAR